jgi:hypothetical protein
MDFNLFGRRRRKRRDGPVPDDARSGDERTPEEEILAERAREEAARRARERLGQAGEVGDLLGGMLDFEEPGGGDAAPSDDASRHGPEPVRQEKPRPAGGGPSLAEVTRKTELVRMPAPASGRPEEVPLAPVSASSADEQDEAGGDAGPGESPAGTRYSLEDLPEAKVPVPDEDGFEDAGIVDTDEALVEIELPLPDLLDVFEEPDRVEVLPVGTDAQSDDAALDRILTEARLGPARAEPGGEGDSAAAPGRRYDLGDLPPVPADSGLTTEPGLTSDDLLAEQTMPELPATAGVEPSAAEPAATDFPAGPGVEGGAFPAREPEEPPVEIPIGTERAADLSVSQLAAVEKLIAREVTAEEAAAATSAGRARPEVAEAGSLNWLLSAGKRIAAGTAGLRAAADRALAPYSLSCRLLLGIAGILMLCLAAALSIRTWVLKIY